MPLPESFSRMLATSKAGGVCPDKPPVVKAAKIASAGASFIPAPPSVLTFSLVGALRARAAVSGCACAETIVPKHTGGAGSRCLRRQPKLASNRSCNCKRESSCIDSRRRKLWSGRRFSRSGSHTCRLRPRRMRTCIASFSSSSESPFHSELGLRFIAPTNEVSHPSPQSGLYESAVFDERIGYLTGSPGICAAAEARSPDPKNGEGISANLPRINTEGAMPTI